LSDEPPGTFEICPVCNWEDDNVQAADPKLRGGANEMSLEQARLNFATFGAISKSALGRVRRPLANEVPVG
jgi:hypothetical protein